MLFLLEQLRTKLSGYMQRLAQECFFHPEYIPECVERMVNVMNLASQFLGLKISSLIREVLQTEVQMQDVTLHDVETPVLLPLGAASTKGKSTTLVQVIARQMCLFLSDVCHKAATASPHNEDESQPVTYSDVYRGFVQWCVDKRTERQRVHVRFTVERVAPLCGLIGSAGVRVIQRQILSTVESPIETILKLVKQNKPYLEQFNKTLRGAGDLVEVIGNIQVNDLRLFLEQSVRIGVFFTMRDILGQGLGLATESMPALSQFFGSVLNSCDGKTVEVRHVTPRANSLLLKLFACAIDCV